MNHSPAKTPDWMKVEEPVQEKVQDTEQTQNTQEEENPKSVLTSREQLIKDITDAGYTVKEALEQIEEMEGKKKQVEESLPEGLQKMQENPMTVEP